MFLNVKVQTTSSKDEELKIWRQKSIMDACDLQALRQHCIQNKEDSAMKITAWAREHSSL